MNTTLSTAPEGARGIDANSPITADVAQALLAAGFSFVVRYVPRTLRHTYDITAAEVETILGAGLGLMLVQHVAPEGWAPSASLGRTYGETAAREAKVVGYPAGAVLWCDLEGVKLGTPAATVVAYCSAWHAAVAAAGYEPGLYVGYGAGLTADELYHALPFTRYWSAYNLDRDRYPAVRGVQMRQGVLYGALPGVRFPVDLDTIQSDAMGDRPPLWMAVPAVPQVVPGVPAVVPEVADFPRPPLVTTPPNLTPVVVPDAPPPRDWSEPAPRPSLWTRLTHPIRSIDPMRAIISRVAAAIVAVLLTFFAGTLGVEVSPAVHDSLVEGVTLLGLGLWGVLYALLHRLIDRKINPADVAKHPGPISDGPMPANVSGGA